MRNYTIIFITIIMCATLLHGQTKQAKWNDYQKWKRFAVLEVMITPPCVKTKLMKEYKILAKNAEEQIVKFCELSEEIEEMHRDRVDAYTEFIGKKFQEATKADVLYGKKFINSPEYIRLKNAVKSYPCTLGNNQFTEIIIQKGSLNFFDLRKISPPIQYNENPKPLLFYSPYPFLEKYKNSKTDVAEIKENLSNVCKILNLDGVVVGTITIEAFRLGPNLESYKRLVIDLNFFNSAGEFLHSQYDSTYEIAEWSRVDKLTYYLRALDQTYFSADRLIPFVYIE